MPMSDVDVVWFVCCAYKGVVWPFKCGGPFLALLMARRGTRTTQRALPIPMPVLVRAWRARGRSPWGASAPQWRSNP